MTNTCGHNLQHFIFKLCFLIYKTLNFKMTRFQDKTLVTKTSAFKNEL